MTEILKECVALVREHMAWIREQETKDRDLQRDRRREWDNRRVRTLNAACRVGDMLLVHWFGGAQAGTTRDAGAN